MCQGLAESTDSPVNDSAVPQLPALPTTQFPIGQSVGCVFWKKVSQVVKEFDGKEN